MNIVAAVARREMRLTASSPRWRVRRRHGATLLELLVALGVVGLLAAIMIPAVQRSRESARSTQCRSHLHQIGVALHNHYDAQRALPRGDIALIQLLPHVDQTALYEKIGPGAPSPAYRGSYRVPLYDCPSDSDVGVYPGELGTVSYFPSWGIKTADTERGWNGLFAHGHRGTRHQFDGTDWRIVRDGLSQTTALAECLLMAAPPHRFQGAQELIALAPRAPRRFTWYTQAAFSDSAALEFAEHCAVSESRTVVRPPFRQVRLGLLLSTPRGYDHLLSPNQISCWNGPPPEPGGDFPAPASLSIAPASSQHPGGAFALYCDGSVRLAADHIDRGIWRALGTVDGAEPIGDF